MKQDHYNKLTDILSDMDSLENRQSVQEKMVDWVLEKTGDLCKRVKKARDANDWDELERLDKEIGEMMGRVLVEQKATEADNKEFDNIKKRVISLSEDVFNSEK